MAKKKSKTKAEQAHMNNVASLGCIACHVIGYEDTPSELHHIRTNVGAGQKSSNYEVIPLCLRHHRQDKNAIHQSKVNFDADFGTEEYLLGMVNGLLGSAA
jgi:hypothetical protein